MISMAKTRKVKRDKIMPTFLVEFWNVDKEHQVKRGYDVTSKALSKRWRKHYFEGIIEHVQTNKRKEFHSVSEFHAFIEQHRLKK